ncbi:MAG: hypothetical protein H6577_16555 [Lewinellaceae bacterium]|nr:hypothetical protein [Lewinellaceae bacterium]
MENELASSKGGQAQTYFPNLRANRRLFMAISLRLQPAKGTCCCAAALLAGFPRSSGQRFTRQPERAKELPGSSSFCSTVFLRVLLFVGLFSSCSLPKS